MSLAFPIERPLTRAIGSSVRWDGRRLWTPAALFAGGQQGVWYEPKPEYLYQDAAGTVPVTVDGDPVGLMLDVSGNGNHATQSTSAARPIHSSSAPLQVYDNVDDAMNVTLPAITAATVAIATPTGADIQYPVDLSSGSYTITGSHSGIIIREGELTAAEQQQVTGYLNAQAGV